MIHSFRGLQVWQKSMNLAVSVYRESELETQIELAQRLKMLSETDSAELMEKTSEVGKMLAGLLKALPKKAC